MNHTPATNEVDALGLLLANARSDHTLLGHQDMPNSVVWRSDIYGADVLVSNDSGMPVEVWLVGELSGRDFWLQPCGSWSLEIARSNSRAGKSEFSHHIASAFVVQSYEQHVRSLFTGAIEELRRVIEMSCEELTPRQPPVGIIDSQGRVKIRHTVFDVSVDYSYIVFLILT